MKRASDRSKSGDMQLSISDLKAVMKSCKASEVKSSTFRASSNFLLTPVDSQSLRAEKRWEFDYWGLTHSSETFCIKPAKLTSTCKRAELRII